MARGYPVQGMSARRLSIVKSSTLRGARAASAAGAAAAALATRGAALRAGAGLAEPAGSGAGASEFVLHAATAKAPASSAQPARRAVFRVGAQGANGKRRGGVSCRNTVRSSVRRVQGRHRAPHSRETAPDCARISPSRRFCRLPGATLSISEARFQI